MNLACATISSRVGSGSQLKLVSESLTLSVRISLPSRVLVDLSNLAASFVHFLVQPDRIVSNGVNPPAREVAEHSRRLVEACARHRHFEAWSISRVAVVNVERDWSTQGREPSQERGVEVHHVAERFGLQVAEPVKLTAFVEEHRQ